MELAGLIIAFAVLVVSGAAAAASVVQARLATAARADAQQALADSRTTRDEVQQLARTATEASVKQAEALIERNEIERRKLPSVEAVWSLEHIRGVRWALRNVGGSSALRANLHDVTDSKGFLRFETNEVRDVPVDDLMEFIVLAADGSPNPRIEVRWSEDMSSPIRSKAFTIVPRT